MQGLLGKIFNLKLGDLVSFVSFMV